MTYQPDLGRLRSLVKDGWLTEQRHPSGELSIFNYTAKTEYNQRWDDDTLNCRGLILDQRGKVMARGFRKFFNYGARMPMPGTSITEITEKVDGSLGICFCWGNEWQVVTRGSFVSEQAQWATNWFREHVPTPDLYLNRYWTFLFEIIYPANRIVVDYGDFEGLVLLGARHTQHGQESYHEELRVIADQIGVLQPRTFTFTDWHQILDAAEALSHNEEGWVIRTSDNERFKVKGQAYKIAHHLMTEVTFQRVLETYIAGSLDTMLEGIPDEFLGNIKRWRFEIEMTLAEIAERAHETFARCNVTSGRKEFARWVKEQPKELHPYLFHIYDGKGIHDLILKTAFKDRQFLPAFKTR